MTKQQSKLVTGAVVLGLVYYAYTKGVFTNLFKTTATATNNPIRTSFTTAFKAAQAKIIDPLGQASTAAQSAPSDSSLNLGGGATSSDFANALSLTPAPLVVAAPASADNNTSSWSQPDGNYDI